MGECGCGELRPDQVVKIGDKVLAIEIYPGCHDCGTGIMTWLDLFTPVRAEEFLLEVSGEFKTDEFGYGQLSFPIIGPDDLVEAVTEIEGENPLKEYNCLADWMMDNGLDVLQRGLAIRKRKTEHENNHA